VRGVSSRSLLDERDVTVLEPYRPRVIPKRRHTSVLGGEDRLPRFGELQEVRSMISDRQKQAHVAGRADCLGNTPVRCCTSPRMMHASSRTTSYDIRSDLGWAPLEPRLRLRLYRGALFL
jgi:hypothetical protein